MSWSVLAWAVLGAIAGEVHVRSLWARVHGTSRWAWLRGPFAIAFFLVAAIIGHVFAAAIGWGIGAVAGSVFRLAVGRD